MNCARVRSLVLVIALLAVGVGLNVVVSCLPLYSGGVGARTMDWPNKTPATSDIQFWARFAPGGFVR
jgi:hypothetical protein